MKVLELFAGTRSISKEFEKRGHEVYTVEWDKTFDNIDLYKDIGELTAQEILENFGHPDVIWASPDCSSYSVAAIYHHRRRNKENGSLEPITDYAVWHPVRQYWVTIRKLTPRECYRLQAFPDDYFDRASLLCSDHQLYKQSGNSVTVDAVEALARKMA